MFKQTLPRKGLRSNHAGLESQEEIGRVERRNQTLKNMMKKVIRETNAICRQAMDMVLSDCINSINEMSRHGGSAPVQWVLGRFPRQLATLSDEEERADIGAIQAHIDGSTPFAIQSAYRLEAREAIVKWDCDTRAQRAMLRNCAPTPGPYKIGGFVSYHRRPRQG